MLPMCGRYTFTFDAESLAEAIGSDGSQAA
jgi:putative SOS response-associated peptidase YedK